MNEIKVLDIGDRINPEEIAIYVDWHDRCDAANLYRAHSGLIEGLNYLAKSFNKDFFNDNYGRFEISKIEGGSILNFLRKKERTPADKINMSDPGVKIFTNKFILFFISVICIQEVLTKEDWNKIAEKFNLLLASTIGSEPAEICKIDSRYLLDKAKYLCKKINFNKKEFDVKLITKEKVLDVAVVQRITDDYIERIFDELLESHTVEVSLEIKKPDLHGDSKWEFVYLGGPIRASVEDLEWLHDVRHKQFKFYSGCQIEVKLLINRIAHGKSKYYVVKVDGGDYDKG